MSAREWAQYPGHKEKHENTFVSDACPALEGYPDCHPDGNESWAPYSTTGEFMAPKTNPATKPKRQISRSSIGVNAY